MIRAFGVVVASAVVAFSVPAFAQDPGSRPSREFVQGAAQSDAFEILEAQVVLAQSTNPQVRDFAGQMIIAHRQMRQALLDAAVHDGLKPPAPGPSGDQAMLLGGLQGESAQDVDKTYARHQLIAHRAALIVEQKFAENGDSPAVRQAAAAAVPMITSHLSIAAQVAASLGIR